MPDNIDETAINVYTDGSSFSTPRRGGMGMLFVTVDADGHEVLEEYCPPGYASATNNQMELQACVEALDYLLSSYCTIDVPQFRKVRIATDSQYVVNNFDNAKFVWPKTRWTTRAGAPVANAQIWKLLTKRVNSLHARVEIEWVKGHKSSAANKAADKLARRSAKGHLRAPLTNVSVRRKKTSLSVERGSESGSDTYLNSVQQPLERQGWV